MFTPSAGSDPARLPAEPPQPKSLLDDRQAPLRPLIPRINAALFLQGHEDPHQQRTQYRPEHHGQHQKPQVVSPHYRLDLREDHPANRVYGRSAVMPATHKSKMIFFTCHKTRLWTIRSDTDKPWNPGRGKCRQHPISRLRFPSPAPTTDLDLVHWHIAHCSPTSPGWQAYPLPHLGCNVASLAAGLEAAARHFVTVQYCHPQQ